MISGKTYALLWLPMLVGAMAGRAQSKPPDMVSLGVGTSGVGAEYRKMFNSRWGANVGVAYMGVAFNFNSKVAYQNIVFDPTIRFFQASVMGEFIPFSKEKDGVKKQIPLRINAGLSYRSNATYEATAQLTQTITIGQFQLTQDEVGYVDLTIQTNKILPYLGAGYDFSFSKSKHWGFGIHGGTWYHGKPDVEMQGSGALGGNTENEAQFEENLSSFRWYPSFSVRINYSIK